MDVASDGWTGPLIVEWDTELRGGDPLRFPGYRAALRDAAGESVRSGLIDVAGVRCALVEVRFEHFGGSMGSVAGEKVVRAFSRATDQGLPVLGFVASGGARMQEGMLSLVQMARTASAVSSHAAAGLLSLGVLRSPTTGGVFASWGSLLDVRAVEPGATIGFGGPRVVAQVTGCLPPATSHNAESAHQAGLVDEILAPGEQPLWAAAALGGADRPLELPPGRPRVPAPATRTPSSAWETVSRVRDRERPSGLEWAAALCSSWVELHGGDPVIRAGLAVIGGRRVVVVLMDRHAEGRLGRPLPAGFRLAQRAVRLADRLGLPVVTLVDTPGAEPGPVAEADGIAGEIARTLQALAQLRTPSVCVCVGEGGSGGAMALAHTDRLLQLEGAVFSVIAPEGASVILWRDASRAPEAADSLRLTAADLLELGLVDEVLPDGGPSAVERVRAAVLRALEEAVPGDRLDRVDGATRGWLHSGRWTGHARRGSSRTHPSTETLALSERKI
ncbi:carboxyl transferase domain-containing protein [Streptosporangium sp. NPDC002544]|uniref:carboxyl transferase domain-containing protein n=1 Tax=Streptosporangium sp. NPDC002544 TaxID=3154538 RepID=UPI00331D7D2B